MAIARNIKANNTNYELYDCNDYLITTYIPENDGLNFSTVGQSSNSSWHDFNVYKIVLVNNVKTLVAATLPELWNHIRNNGKVYYNMVIQTDSLNKMIVQGILPILAFNNAGTIGRIFPPSEGSTYELFKDVKSVAGHLSNLSCSISVNANLTYFRVQFYNFVLNIS